MGLVEKIAEEHFAEADTEKNKYLVSAVYERINDENMFDFFTSENFLIRKAVARRIYEHLNDNEFVKRVIEGLDHDDRAEGILTALSYANLRKNPAILAQAGKNLLSDNAKIQEAAATVIAYQYPENAGRILPFLKDNARLAKIACHSANPELVWPLLEYYNYPKSDTLPPYVGFLLNPVWLSNNYDKNPEAISRLIDTFGYSNTETDENVLSLLRKGLMFVSRDMADQSEPGKWLTRMQDFMWALLPDSLGMQKKEVAVNLEDKIDVDLFLASARECDVTNLQAKKERDPFSYRKAGIDVAISHAYYRYYKRKIIDEAFELAEKLGVREQYKGEFILDHARVLLETNNEAYVEADVCFRSKWLALSKVVGIEKNPKKFPVTEEKDFPLAKYGVIDSFPLTQLNPGLSLGANSVVNVCNYFGMSGADEKLQELEQRYSQFLIPIGIELQIPKCERNTSLGYKQALRYFGIPSPRRPEYFDMIETAFRPARTFHTFAIGIMLMHKLGLMKYEQDCAYHISVQGNLKDEVRYIAFPEMFMNRPRRKIEKQEERFYRMSRLMSKGFININNDVEPCIGIEKPECRTEIRVFCCQTDEIDGESKLRLTCIDDLISTHLLTSACASQNPEFRTLWDAYKNEIIRYTKTLQQEFSDFLYANWFEATGDPRDGNLVGMLPVIQKREKISDIVKKNDMMDELEMNFKNIIKEHSKQIHDKFVELYASDYNFSGFCRCSYDVPYFVPETLMPGMTNTHFSLK